MGKGKKGEDRDERCRLPFSPFALFSHRTILRMNMGQFQVLLCMDGVSLTTHHSPPATHHSSLPVEPIDADPGDVEAVAGVVGDQREIVLKEFDALVAEIVLGVSGDVAQVLERFAFVFGDS